MDVAIVVFFVSMIRTSYQGIVELELELQTIPRYSSRISRMVVSISMRVTIVDGRQACVGEGEGETPVTPVCPVYLCLEMYTAISYDNSTSTRTRAQQQSSLEYEYLKHRIRILYHMYRFPVADRYAFRLLG